MKSKQTSSPAKIFCGLAAVVGKNVSNINFFEYQNKI
jgi:hypothetical protein